MDAGAKHLVAALGLLLLVACNQNREAQEGTTDDATGGKQPAAASTPKPATAPAAVPEQPARSGADLGVAESADHGKYLVDATGKTLYVLDKDSMGASSCYDACSTQWPPLLSPEGIPKALDPSIEAGAIVTIQRTDGGVQVTYQAKPLYHYANDLAAGQLNGQGVKDQFGEWHIVKPSGEASQGD